MSSIEVKCLKCGWMLGHVRSDDKGSYTICPVCGAIVHYRGVHP